MLLVLGSWFKSNRVLILNTVSLVGTMAIASGLGVVYWWLAARVFPPTIVGLGSAAISAMSFLGNFGMLGFGTLLIGELPRQPNKAGALITTSLLVAGVVSGVLGILFAIIAPYLTAEFQPLIEDFDNILLFTLGVVLTSVTLVLDHALVGLFRADFQLLRNIFLAILKLAALYVVGVWLANKSGLALYTTWTFGNLISMILLARVFMSRGIQIIYRPELRLLKTLGRTALAHHSLNLALQTPGLVLPVLVTIALSASTNAGFYIAWMIISFIFGVLGSLTTMLYAVSVTDRSTLLQKTRLTLKLSLIFGSLMAGGVIIAAGFLLSFFGKSYVEHAETSLRILALGVFPVIIKVHYVAICRVGDQISRATKFMALGACLEIVLAALGATLGNLIGLCLGWVIAIFLEAIFAGPVVYQTVTSIERSKQLGRMSRQTVTISSSTTQQSETRNVPNYIRILLPQSESRSVPIGLDQLILGRSPRTCDIVINDPLVSRVHLKVVRMADDQLSVTDLCTANGTILNGEKLMPNRPQVWSIGQPATIGKTLLIPSFSETPIPTSNLDVATLEPINVDETLPDKEREALIVVDRPRKDCRENSQIRIRSVAWVYLPAFIFAELLTTVASPWSGLALYTAILSILLLRTAQNWALPIRKLMLSLCLVPLARLISFSILLVDVSVVYQYLIISISLFITIILIVRKLGSSLNELKLHFGLFPKQALIGLTGIAFGLLEYQLVKPTPTLIAFSWPQLLFLALALVIATGLIEELIFRKMIQEAAIEHMGSIRGIIYTSCIYGLLYVGRFTWLNIVVVVGISLFYSLIMIKTKSLIGIIISHGLTNIMLYLTFPFIISPK